MCIGDVALGPVHSSDSRFQSSTPYRGVDLDGRIGSYLESLESLEIIGIGVQKLPGIIRKRKNFPDAFQT